MLRIKLEGVVVLRFVRKKWGYEIFQDMFRHFRLAVGMSNSIPAVGSFALLDVLTDFVPDDFINANWPIPYRRGPRFACSSGECICSRP